MRILLLSLCRFVSCSTCRFCGLLFRGRVVEPSDCGVLAGKSGLFVCGDHCDCCDCSKTHTCRASGVGVCNVLCLCMFVDMKNKK